MYSHWFIVAALGYIAMTVFIFFNYPESWLRNKVFITIMTVWHAVGLSAVVMVFTVFRSIPYDGVRYAIARIGSMYYVTMTLLSILFFVRMISSRTYMFVMDRTGKEISPWARGRLTDKRFHSIVFIIISLAVFFAGYFNIDVLHDTRYDVTVNASSEEKELNICLISDIHAGSATGDHVYDDLITLIGNSNPDVLFIAGDAFDETTGSSDVAALSRVLSEIRRPEYGIFYIYGNHDSSVDDWAAQQMREMGVTVLEDEITVIGNDIQLIGCMDPTHGAKSVDALFNECRPDPDKPVLVLTHRPQHFSRMSDLGCDLVMAGHTHGFNIPQFSGLNLFGDMYSGIRQYGEMTAITTSGVSAWGFHYKWPAVSEVVTIHVTFADN